MSLYTTFKNMSIPLPIADQYECRNETLEVYASDRRGEVVYQFNNYGYRNNIDYQTSDSDVGIYIGSSITSAIGVNWEKGFVHQTSDKMQTKPYHFSQGCTEVDNQEILRMLRLVKETKLDARYYVLQFINLNRVYNHETGITFYSDDKNKNTEKFLETFEQICELLKDSTWCFIGCDAQDHKLPSEIIHHDHCVSWNPTYIDHAGVGTHPGVKWHRMISLGLTKYLKQCH